MSSGTSQLSIKGCGEKRPITEYSSTSATTVDPALPPPKRPRASSRHENPRRRSSAASALGPDQDLCPAALSDTIANDEKTEPLAPHKHTRPPSHPRPQSSRYDHDSPGDHRPNKFSDVSRCANCLRSDHALAVCRNVTTEYLKGCPWCNSQGHNLDDCPYRPSMTDTDLIELLILNRQNTVMIYTSFDWLRLFKRYSDDSNILARARGFPHTLGFARQTIANGQHFLRKGKFVYGKHVKGDPLTMDARTILKNLDRQPHVFIGQTAISPPHRDTIEKKPASTAENPSSASATKARGAPLAPRQEESPVRPAISGKIRTAESSPERTVSESCQTDRERGATTTPITMTDAESQTEVAQESKSDKELKHQLAELEKRLEEESIKNRVLSDAAERDERRFHDELEEERRRTRELSDKLDKERQRYHHELEAARKRIDGLVDKLLS